MIYNVYMVNATQNKEAQMVDLQSTFKMVKDAVDNIDNCQAQLNLLLDKLLPQLAILKIALDKQKIGKTKKTSLPHCLRK